MRQLCLWLQRATVPFIARYRKEQTGNLDEVAIRGILETNEEFSEFVKRKAFVLEQVQKAGKLDAALKTIIESCDDALILEDIYAPFKPKKKAKQPRLVMQVLSHLLYGFGIQHRE